MSSRPRWQRLEPDARRQQILSCAVRQFGARPYAEVSTTSIAAEAGVARGLVHHYFGTKKELYLEVLRRLLTVPEAAVTQLPDAALPVRVDASVTWFLETVERHSRPWLAALDAGSVAHDPEVAQVVSQADEVAADRVLAAVGLQAKARRHEEVRAMVRAYGALAKAAAREWLERGSLAREDVHLLLTTALLSLVESVVPQVSSRPRSRGHAQPVAGTGRYPASPGSGAPPTAGPAAARDSSGPGGPVRTNHSVA